MSVKAIDPDTAKVLGLSLALGLVIAVANYLLVVQPLWTSYSEKSEKFHKIYNRLKQSRAKVKDEELLVYIKKLKDKISAIEERIVPEFDLPFLMEDIANMAKDSGLELKQIVPKDSVPVKDRKLRNLRFSQILFIGTGGYHELGRFISALENSKYVCKIESITIIPDSWDYRNSTVKVLISVLTRKE